MTTVIITIVAFIFALAFVGVKAIRRHFTSWELYRKNVASQELVQKMRLEHWFGAMSPVWIVEYEDDMPPGNRPKPWPDGKK